MREIRRKISFYLFIAVISDKNSVAFDRSIFDMDKKNIIHSRARSNTINVQRYPILQLCGVSEQYGSISQLYFIFP